MEEYVQTGHQVKHRRKIYHAPVSEPLIYLPAEGEGPRGRILRKQKGDRDCQPPMLPLGTLPPLPLVLDLQLQELVIDVGDPVLGGILERKSRRIVLVVFSRAGEGELGEITHKKCAVVVAEDGDWTGHVLDFKLVGLVGLDGQVCQFEEGGGLVGVTKGVLALAELEDEEAEQHHRLHFE